MLQEHWLYPNTIERLNNNNNTHEVFAISSMKDDFTELGRPFGGLAVLIKHNILNYINYIGCSQDKRCMAFKLICNDSEIFLFNIYFPCYVNDLNYEGEVLNIIGFCENVLLENLNRNVNTQIIMGGDFNFDEEKLQNSKVLQCFSNFMLCTNLKIANNNIQYTFHNDTRSCYSKVDHFLISESLQNKCDNIFTIHSSEDFSDHLPIMLNAKIDLIKGKKNKDEKISTPNYVKISDWSSKSKDIYYNNTLLALNRLPFFNKCNCKDFCASSDHRKFIDNYTDTVVSALKNSLVTKVVSKDGFHAKSFWDKDLSLLKKNAYEAHKLWLSVSKPRNGMVFDNYKKEKNLYKLSIRQKKKESEKSKGEYVERLLNINNKQKFWKEWANIMSKHKVKNNPSIKGASGNRRSCDCFADYFSSKFGDSNSNIQLTDEFLNLYSNINSKVRTTFLSVEDIEKGANSLAHGSTCDNFGLSVECILYSHPITFMHLKSLYDACLIHGYVPQCFKTGMIIPVPKCNVMNEMSCDQFRPITIIPILSKIFECCILAKFKDKLSTHVNQFGYKQNGGCERAIFYVTSIVNYFMKKHNNVYIATLDASAAFDKINIYGMLSKLIKLQVNFDIVRLFLSWYSGIESMVKWASELSDVFRIKSGVRQGGLASAFLFTVYVDDLLQELNNLDLGCHFDEMWLGALMYADDLILISGSIKKLQSMLDCCDEFGLKMDLSFNTKKSFYYCTSNINHINFKLSSDLLRCAGTTFKYLGVNLGIRQGKFCVIPDERIGKFVSSSMSVCRNTVNMPISVRLELLNKKCVPILMYGLCAGVCTQDKKRLSVIYRNAYRFIFQVGLYSPVSEIMFYCNVPSFDFLYDKTYLFACKKIVNDSDVCLRSYHRDMVASLEGIYNVNSHWSLGKIKKVMKLYDNNRLLHLD